MTAHLQAYLLTRPGSEKVAYTESDKSVLLTIVQCYFG